MNLKHHLRHAVQSLSHPANGVLPDLSNVVEELIVSFNERGQVGFLNSPSAKVLGLQQPNAAYGMHIKAFFSSEAWRGLESIALPTVKGSGVWKGETVLLNEESQRVPMSALLFRQHDAGSESNLYTLIMVPAPTSSGQSWEDDWQTQFGWLQSALGGSSRLDQQGCFVAIDSRHAQLLGKNEEEFVGESLCRFIRSKNINQLPIAFENARTKGSSEVSVWSNTVGGAELNLVLIRCINRHKIFGGFLLFIRDMSQYQFLVVEAEAKLKQMRLRLSQMNAQVEYIHRDLELSRECERALQSELSDAQHLYAEAKDIEMSFLANMNHELRTPLAAILGYSELLSGKAVTSEHEQAQWIERIHFNGQRLMHLIENLLALTRTGKSEGKPYAHSQSIFSSIHRDGSC